MIFRADNPVALYNVATHYFAGKGVELSFEKAAEYFEKAAILQFPPAQVGIANTVLVCYIYYVVRLDAKFYRISPDLRY